VALVTRLDPEALLEFAFNRGDLLVIASHVMLAGYTVALRFRPQGLDGLAFLACFALVALAPVGLAYAGEIAAGKCIILNSTSLAGLAYVAVFPALLAYHFWALGVARMGAARAGVFFYLTPLFGGALAIALLGERPGLH